MQIFDFTHQGKRAYQEDAHAQLSDIGLYLVCDGVGGSTRGDLASQTVISVIGDRLSQVFPSLNNFETSAEDVKAAIQAAVQEAQQKLVDLATQEPEFYGMATTLTLAWWVSGNWYLAHVGDSRIYYISQENQSYWRTKDHSMVQDLFDKGYLKSEVEMETHPQSNRINRALQAKKDTSFVNADISVLGQYAAGDLLLLCSDGVLEPFGNQSLTYLLADKKQSLKKKVSLIQDRCEEYSKDNNTAIFLELDNSPLPGSGLVAASLPLIAAPLNDGPEIELIEQEPALAAAAAKPTGPTGNSRKKPPFLPLMIGFVLGLGLLVWQPWNSKNTTPDSPPETEVSNDSLNQSQEPEQNNSTSRPTQQGGTNRPPATPATTAPLGGQEQTTPTESPAENDNQTQTIAGELDQSQREILNGVGGSSIQDGNRPVATPEKPELEQAQSPQSSAPTPDKPEESVPSQMTFQQTFADSGPFNRAIDDQGKYVFINQQQEPVFEFRFEQASPMLENRAAVRAQWVANGRKWFYINRDGNRAFDGDFETAGNFIDGAALVTVDDETYTIDVNGNRISSN